MAKCGYMANAHAFPEAPHGQYEPSLSTLRHDPEALAAHSGIAQTTMCQIAIALPGAGVQSPLPCAGILRT